MTGSQLTVGSSNNTFEYSLNEGTDANDYNITKTEGTLTVTNRDAKYEITVEANSATATYDGQSHSATGVKTLEFTVEGNTYTVSGLTTQDPTQVNAGTYTNNITGTPVVKDAAGNDVSSEFSVKTVNGSLVIDKATVTFTGESATRTYTGEEIELTDVTVEGVVSGQTHNVTYSAKGTEVGVYDGTITAVADVKITDASGADVTSNYAITTTPGKLTIEQTDEQLTVTLDDAEYKYDGKAHAIETPATTNAKSGTTTIEYSKDGTTWTTDLSTLTATNKSDSCTIQVRATNPNYKNTATDTAELKITPRNVTLTSADGEKQYDGTPLVKNAQTDITVGGDGFVAGEGATYNITGSQTEVGESKNTFTYDLNEGTLAENYVFASTPGTLKVTKSEAELSVASADGEWTYDGSAHTKKTYTVTYGTEKIEGTEGQTVFTLSTGDKLTVTPAATATITNAADSTVDNAFTWTVENESFYTKGEDTVGTLTINPKDVTISTGSAEKKYDGTPLTESTVTIEGLVEGESVTLKATGSQTEVGDSKNTYSITWDNATATNYNVTENLGTLKVTSTDAKVTLTAASDDQVYNGQALVNAEVTATGLPEGITATATASGSQTNVGSSKNVVNDGYVFKDAAGNDVTKNFTNVEKVDGTLEVTPAPVTITTGSAEKPYDGTPLTESTATITGLVNNETATVTATGAQTEVGSSKNTYSINWGTTDAKNYEVTEKLGTLEVTRNTAEVVLTAPSDTKVYDGTALTCDGTGEKKVTATGLPEGFTVEATASGSQTNAGKSDNVVNSGWVIKDASGADKTANFTNVTTEKGTLEVTKRPVTLKSATLSQEYNGAALINGSTPLETEEGWVEGEGATYTFTRSQTLPGSTDNVFTYKLNEGTLEDNYDISVSYGSLIVTNRESKYEITLVANSGEFTYDGKEHSAVGVETNKFTFDGVEYTVSGFTTENPAQTNAGTYTNNISAENGFKVTDPQGNDVSSEFKVTPKNGELVINKRTVTLTSADGEKVYDGTPLTKNAQTDVTVGGDGFVSGEGATYDITGTQTDAGESKNAFSYKLNEGTLEDNYTITTTEGTLKVTPVTDKVTVTITEHGGEYTYDGTEKTATGYDFKADNDLYTEDCCSFTGNATVKGTDAGTYNMELKSSDFANTSENFTNVEFVIVDATLVINKRAVTLTSETAEKVYDGTPLTRPTVTIGGDGFVEGEVTDVKATGTVTNVSEGTVTNTITYTEGAAFKADNYTITKTEGTLKINPVTDKVTVTITEHSGEFTYDGKEKTVEGYDVTSISNELYTENDFSFSGTAEVKGTNAGTYNMELKPADFANTSENFTNVVFEIVDGQLMINPKTIEDPGDPGNPDETHFTVEGPEDTIYNAKEQKQPVTVTDKDTGKKLEEGKDCTIAYSDDVVNAGEVTVTVTGINNYTGEFKLTYNILRAPLTITTADDEKVYDATPLTNHNYTIDIVQNEGVIRIESSEELVTLLENDTLGVDITGSQTLVGSSGNVGKLKWAKGDTTPILAAAIALRAAADPTAKQSNYDVNVKVGTLTVTDEDVPTELVVKKMHEDREYGLGETVTFELTATNIYDETRDITFIEIEGVEIAQAEWPEVPAGETVTTTATYVVTEADILAGEFTNKVSVKIGDAEHGPYEDPVDIEKKNPHLTVTKTVTSTAPAGGYAAGDKIAYEIVVENDGNVTISDIKVTDDLTGDKWEVESLAPGEKKSFTAEYTVTEADVEKGSVKNTATATGKDPEGDDPTVVPGTTETPTAPKPALPKTGDASSLVSAVASAAAGLASLAGWLHMKRRRNEDDER